MIKGFIAHERNKGVWIDDCREGRSLIGMDRN